MTSIRARQPYARRPSPQGPLKPFLDTELANVQRAVPIPITRTVVADASVVANDDLILAAATGGPITVSLGPADRLQFLKVTIKRVNGTGDIVTVSGDMGDISSFELRTAGQSLTVQSDGVVWQLVQQDLDPGSYVIPQDGRTDTTLTEYLANDAMYNVRDYRLATDAHWGVTIQRTIDAAPDGGRIRIPCSTVVYDVGATINITGRSQLTIQGDGWGAHVHATALVDIFVVDDASASILFRDFKISGISVAEEGVAAIRSAGNRATVDHCEISDINAGAVFSMGTYIAGHANCDASHNYIHDIKGHNSGSGYGIYTDFPHTVVGTNRFENVGRHDVYLSGNAVRGCDGTTVIGNTSEANGVEAIGTNAPAGQPPLVGLVISGNAILNPLGYGIGLSVNTWGAAVTNNTIDNVLVTAGFAPITIDGGSVLLSEIPMFNVIANNTITRNAYPEAIRLLNASYCLVKDNIMSAATRGVIVTSTGTPPLFPTGNEVSGNIAVGSIVPVVIDVSCIDTIVGPNYGTVASSIGNNRNFIVVTNNALTTVSVPDSDTPVTIEFNQTGTQTITDFPGGRDGQLLTIYFNSTSAVTVTNAHCFFVGGALSFVSTQFDTLELVRIGGSWFERSRSLN